MKKILLVSAVALGLSSVALANGGMAAAPIATAAVASSDFTPGIVVGIQGGYADTGLKAMTGDYNTLGTLVNGTVSKDTGIAGRLFVGYDATKYFGAQLGYMLVGKKTDYKMSGDKVADIRLQAFDLVGVIKAPIMDNFGVYAKAGPGYLMKKSNAVGDSSVTTNKFDLVYGFGLLYNFADNWTVDASYTRYNSGHTKQDKNWQPVVDFYSLGVSYKFNLPV